MQNYSDISVELRNSIAKSLGSNLKNHLSHMKDYLYYTDGQEFIVLDGTKIIAKNVKTSTFVQSIPDYKKLQPNVVKDDVETWGNAGFIVNGVKIGLVNEDSDTTSIFPMKYTEDDRIIRSYNKKMLTQYSRKEISLGNAGHKMVDKMLPGIASVKKQEVYQKINQLLKTTENPTDINSMIKSLQAGKVKKRYIRP